MEGVDPDSSNLKIDQQIAPNPPVQSLVVESLKVKNKRSSYALSIKRQVIGRLETNSNNGIKYPIRKTAEEFNIKYNLVQKWWAEKDKFMNSDADGSMRKLGVGRKRKHPDIEEALVEWVREQRDTGLAVLNKNIANEAMRRFPHRFSSYDSCLKWIYNILDRNGLSIRRKKHGQGVLQEAD